METKDIIYELRTKKGLSQEELVRTRDETAPPPVYFQHCQGMKAVTPADKEVLKISVPEESFKCESGTQEQYIDNDYSPALWLTQLPYTLFYTYKLVYNSKTTLPKEIQLSFYRRKCSAAAAAAKSLQSCRTLSDPMDCSLPGSSVHGLFPK